MARGRCPLHVWRYRRASAPLAEVEPFLAMPKRRAVPGGRTSWSVRWGQDDATVEHEVFNTKRTRLNLRSVVDLSGDSRASKRRIVSSTMDVTGFVQRRAEAVRARLAQNNFEDSTKRISLRALHTAATGNGFSGKGLRVLGQSDSCSEKGICDALDAIQGTGRGGKVR